MQGYYQIKRGTWNDPVFKKAPFTEREAWLWLHEYAFFKEKEWRYKNSIVTIRQGEIPTSYRMLQETWQWGINRIRRFLSLLAENKKVTLRTDTGFLIISLINTVDYKDYKLKQSTKPERKRTHKEEIYKEKGELSYKLQLSSSASLEEANYEFNDGQIDDIKRIFYVKTNAQFSYIIRWLQRLLQHYGEEMFFDALSRIKLHDPYDPKSYFLKCLANLSEEKSTKHPDLRQAKTVYDNLMYRQKNGALLSQSEKQFIAKYEQEAISQVVQSTVVEKAKVCPRDDLYRTLKIRQRAGMWLSKNEVDLLDAYENGESHE